MLASVSAANRLFFERDLLQRIGIRKKRALFKLHSRVLSSHFPEALKKVSFVDLNLL